MKIEHVSFLTNDLEKMRDFYETYFAAKSSVLYHFAIRFFNGK